LPCGWCHNSRKLILIALVIENGFDCELDCTTWTAILNWNLRQMFSAWHSQDFHCNRYKPPITVVHMPSSLPIDILSKYYLLIHINLAISHFLKLYFNGHMNVHTCASTCTHSRIHSLLLVGLKTLSLTIF
jgi:hypothetical protein